MFLTTPQRHLLDILRQFGTIRTDQAEKLLKMQEPKAQFHLTLRPLEYGGRIQRHGEYLTLQHSLINTDMMEMIDIMLLLEPTHIVQFQKGAHPFAVTFFKNREDKLWRYDICRVVPGTEPVITALLEGINAKYRMLIFVLERPEQQNGLAVQCERCFVWKEDGEYKFYK